MKIKPVKWKTRKGDLTGYGLDEEQQLFLFNLVAGALEVIDKREQHFMLMVLTREASDSETDTVSSNMISSKGR
jgi:hypothetical protein